MRKLSLLAVVLAAGLTVAACDIKNQCKWRFFL
jgi:hypothetical protein